MPDYAWPDAQHRTLIGTRVSRVDSPAKVSGQAKYTYDVHQPGMLYGKVLRCPYAHAKIVSLDTSAAEKMPGVKAVHIVQGPGTTIHWAGDEIVAVAAVDEPTAEDAIRLIKVEYKQLEHLVSDAEPPKSGVQEEGPLSMDTIDDMLDNQVPAGQMVSQIQQYGITEKPSEDTLNGLKEDGASDAVLDALRTAAVHAEVASKLPSSYQKAAAQTTGDPEKAFAEAAVVSEGLYGIPVITHCCLESHGSISEWTDPDHLFTHISTQNVSGIPGQMAESLKMPATNIRVHEDHIGGGFGSKFSPDRWGIFTAEISKKAGGKPVRIMLERDAELEVAGARPSAYARVKVGATKDGTVVAWQSNSWGTGGPGGGGMPPIPYVFSIPNQRQEHIAIRNNIGPARAWRAPNHPQAAVLTMCALDDLAAKLNMDPAEFFGKNLNLTKQRESTYREELAIASELMDWKQKWHPRTRIASGDMTRGVGLSFHTWGGRGHASDCDLTIHPDGSVDIKLGTQDLGTGTRTCILIVASETLGIPMEAIQLQIGDTTYPPSGGSGGSTTIGGVSSSTRRAAADARDALFAKVAPALNTQPDQLECVNGKVSVKGDSSRSLSWKEACSKLGVMPLTIRGKNPDKSKPPDLTNSGVGGVQMAEVEVDTDTGVVKVKKMVAVQDCGLVIDLKTAETQCYGALIMGISYSLYEEKVMDPTTGRMLNSDMGFYRLAGLSDIPELVVHMMTGKGYDERGVIGLGEPPVISPGAAISNAVANAIGVRVPFLPLTPDPVLAALEQKAGA
ncbi:Xanthine dehydrogenase, molybdenum binding subunit apoprotein [Candidatus Sulfotelmatobacter kueseliae]|uniref:Xanthine dehydrogenase, molybdenum binding subunit apoprotein n=1 Tax=Candidatus Sulfotelmatobacter kueseliae TaxID=2042962 RepID=A0A2U3L3V4_9BACT|nr:Xanthine dehydrogenase, molybdenum binding subunit apoprotein [Candidatus Sulfotelmatobacter kueseliae]